MKLSQRLFPQIAMLNVVAVTLATGCSSPGTSVAEIDAQADQVFRQMCDTLGEAKSLRFKVNALTERPVETGQFAKFRRKSEITLVRPDRLYIAMESDDGGWRAWHRGTTLTVLDTDTNAYATEEVPGRVEDMLDYLADEYDLVIPMADLLVDDVRESMLADVISGTYLGRHAVGGTPCHHLLFRQENIDWQIWIDAGARPLPRKLVITSLDDPDQPQYAATIDAFEVDPMVPADAFTFQPPAGTRGVTLAELVEAD